MTDRTRTFIAKVAGYTQPQIAITLARTDQSIVDELRETFHHATLTELAKSINARYQAGQESQTEISIWVERARRSGITSIIL